MNYEQAEQKGSHAWIAIGDGDLEVADQIGKKLIEAGYESGYRIRSAVQENQENWEEAEAIIREGLEKFPQIWQLHLQLGTLNYLLGRFEEALHCYDEALKLPEVEKHWVEINQAAVYAQTSEVDKALNLLQGIDNVEMRNSAFEMKLQILDQFTRYELILELAEEELENLVPPETEEEASGMSRILAHVAAASFYEEQSEEATRFYLKQAIAYDRGNDLALMIARELKGEFAEPGTLYGIMVQGKYKQDDQQLDFLTTYGVLADNVDEAISMIKEFEVEEIDRASLTVLEVEQAAPEEEEELKGIYFVGGLGFVED